LAIAIIPVYLLVAGCVSHIERTPIAKPASPLLPAPPESPSASSVEGRAIACRVFGAGPETILIVAGIHGSEPAGGPLVERLCGYLQRQPAILTGRRVIVVPEANPDGLARNRRTNARGVDANRNFPARNWRSRPRHGATPLSEPEAQFIASLIQQYRPIRIVTIHQPLSCVDWDGPGRTLAETVSHACGLPVRELRSMPGSLGSYAGVDLQIPTITLELPKGASKRSRQALWQDYGGALLVAICFDGVTQAAK